MNPFKFGTVVSGHFFYNREDELQRIKQILIGGNNITLYAPRRYGKTSLVNKVLQELDEEGFTTIYLDMMSVYSRDTFINNYAGTIAEKQNQSLETVVKKIAKYITGVIPSVAFDSAGTATFSLKWVAGEDKERTLSDIINLPEKLAAEGEKWIVVFDEFQEITKLNGESFEKQLRSVIQHHQNVTYLFLGSKTHLLRDMFNNRNRAFYNAATVMNLNAIAESKSIEFLIDRFRESGIHMGQDTAEYLINGAQNIPYYIQFIGYEIWQSGQLSRKNQVTIRDVDDAIEQILTFKADYYWELISKQTSYRKKVLKALSQSVKEIYSKQTTLTFDLGAVSSTQKAIGVFIEDGIIEQNQPNYEFADPIFKKFVKRVL